MNEAERVASIVEQIRPLLAGLGCEIQGAVLADLLAMWLAGHIGEHEAELREELLACHIACVRALIPFNESMLLERANYWPADDPD